MKKMIRLFSCFIVLMIANAASAQGLKAVDDSQNVGKVEWLNRSENVGKIPPGTPVTREFKMKNVSRENLLILSVRSTCHCATVEWPQEPVKPGETGVFKVTYDAQKEGDFYKIVAVSTNFDPNQTVPFALIGKVEKREELSAKQ
jgi:hypothetical protein